MPKTYTCSVEVLLLDPHADLEVSRTGIQNVYLECEPVINRKRLTLSRKTLASWPWISAWYRSDILLTALLRPRPALLSAQLFRGGAHLSNVIQAGSHR
jgi:hypothetical protein